MKRLIFSLLAMASLLFLFPNTAQAQDMEDQTIVEIAAGSDDYSTLVAAVKAAGMAETLSGDGPFTVFAPTNAAFDRLPAGVLEALLMPKNKETLKQVLSYHVVSGNMMATDVTAAIKSNNGMLKASTVGGSDFTVMTEGGKVKIKDGQGNVATVTSTDIAGSNGVIHTIDRVLLPKSVDAAMLTTTGKTMNGMVDDAKKDMKNMTDNAKKDMNNMADNAKKDMNDMTTMKDDRMMDTEMNNRSSRNMGSDVQTSYRMNTMSGQTISKVASGNSDFSTLVTALKAADLVETFDSQGEYTVFAPTNDAFNKLPEGKVNDLVTNDKETLKKVLAFHVIPARITSTQLVEAIKANRNYYLMQTLGGETLVATLKNGKVEIIDGNGNRSTVVATDVDASNGVIHGIDTVIMPRARM